jgi:hypothetical protein
MNPRILSVPSKILLPFFLVASVAAQDRPWQSLSDPTVAELAPHFATPPATNSSQVSWGWGGVISRESIDRDLDHIRSMNLFEAYIEPGRNPAAHYLSPAYFENVKIAVEEAKKRGMHIWFDDDGGYPSGFAGGMFTRERPDKDMKALAPTEQVPVSPGQTFTRMLDDQTICALSVNLDTGDTHVMEPNGGQVSWTAPDTGRWAVDLPKWVFRSGVTRSSNNQTGAKDNEHSLMDYLDPAADQLFINWTFEAYKKAVGNEFGKTFLGFRGDEASFGFNPWTPNFLAEFQARKDYDVRPYLPAIAAIQIGRSGGGRRSGGAGGFRPPPAPPLSLDAAHRAFADYCDVWSDLFGQNFFSAGAQWCAANHLEMQTHIEHEEILPQLAIADGDFFKCMRDIQVPGIDVIWHQMWDDVVADFSKEASSAAHLSGHPQSMSESFAAMGGLFPTPNLDEAGWIVNHQIALGITHFEFMSLRSSAPMPPGGAGTAPRPVIPSAENIPSGPIAARGVAPAGYRYINDAKFPELAAYTNRTTYLLEQGTPAAQIGVYIPSTSFWFDDNGVNKSFLTIVHSLLEHQEDLDYVDEYALTTSMKLQDGEFINKSGQGYRAIVIPPVVAISQAALDRLQAFAGQGGKVLFIGGAPKIVMHKNFLTATPPGDLSWAVMEPSSDVTVNVLTALPPSDVSLDQISPGLKYIHRKLKDGDVYFFFNEGGGAISVNATVATSGAATQVQSWDAHSGQIGAFAGASIANGKVTLPLSLESWATKLVVISGSPGRMASN